MDRKEYWNNDYMEYWKKATEDAEGHESERSGLKKLSGNDYKTPDVEVMTSLFQLIPYRKDDKLLDYGCGFGRFYTWFSQKCVYFGIDISEAMIRECISRYPEAKDSFLVAEGEKLPFRDGYFNVIICNGVFDACYQEKALSEMLRTLADEGYLLISGKNYNYFEDDKEAIIAEENARKKGHPNYFTNVKSMLSQIDNNVTITTEKYALRRGDYAKNIFQTTLPDVFYEYVLILRKKRKEKIVFETFSDEYSLTYRKLMNKVETNNCG